LVYSTGEGWPVAMWDNSADLSNGAIMNKNNGSHLSFVFYMAQTLICDYIFLSLIQIIIIEQFEKYYLPKDNTINIFKKDVEYASFQSRKIQLHKNKRIATCGVLKKTWR